MARGDCPTVQTGTKTMSAGIFLLLVLICCSSLLFVIVGFCFSLRGILKTTTDTKQEEEERSRGPEVSTAGFRGVEKGPLSAFSVTEAWGSRRMWFERWEQMSEVLQEAPGCLCRDSKSPQIILLAVSDGLKFTKWTLCFFQSDSKYSLRPKTHQERVLLSRRLVLSSQASAQSHPEESPPAGRKKERRFLTHHHWLYFSEPITIKKPNTDRERGSERLWANAEEEEDEECRNTRVTEPQGEGRSSDTVDGVFNTMLV